MKKKSIGEYLRDTRLAKGLTVEHIADELDIPLQYITVMELNQFRFAREGKINTYLESYGNFLGLDSDLLLEGYKNPNFEIEVGEVEEDESADESSSEEKERKSDKAKIKRKKWSRSDRFDHNEVPSRLPLAILSLLSIGIIGIIGFIIYIQITDENKVAALPSSSLSQRQVNPNSSGSSSSNESKLTTKANGSNMSVKLSDDNNSETVVEISQTSELENMISVTNSNLDKKGYTLNGSSQSVTATLNSEADISVITLSTTNDMTVKINGENVDLSGLNRDKPAYITLSIK
ncbi:helix-turn-helix domain-containing protein [Streptococcus dentapri]|uniref:Helix-turn-helix domain-containing protein n=1 Tax=Streptococcus dentapri TaxID=573564 RepID=A0ABV8D2E9_9STRE